MSIVKKIPPSEELVVTSKNSKKEIFYTTRNSSNQFSLYKLLSDGTLDRIEKGKPDPLSFNKIIFGNKK